MQVETFSVGPLATNCYLIWDESSLQGYLIDPGDEGDFLSEKILQKAIKLQAILVTHGHFDHVLGLLPLTLNFPGVPIYLHKADRFLYEQAGNSAKHWVPSYQPDPLPPYEPTPPPRVPEVILTPGHTPGSVCYFFREAGIVCSGDTLFQGSVGSTNHQYSSALELSKSLHQLATLPPQTRVYPGHGEPTTISQEFA